SAMRSDVRLPLHEVSGERRRPRHLETGHDNYQRLDIAWVEIEVGVYDVAIERHVQGLVLRDPTQRVRESRVVLLSRPRGAEVEGACHRLLDGGVDHPLEWTAQLVGPPGCHDGLSRAGACCGVTVFAQQVSFEERRVLILFRRPQADEFLDWG